MSGTAFAVEWLRVGGMTAGAWAVLAVLVKVAADRTDPGPAARPSAEPTPGPAAPPRPSFPPSAARHAGPPALDEVRLLTAASVSLTKRPTWN
ncbi:hypothetical protein AB0E99_22645 [Streptomyces sp. NPDC030592]|uniref:hypothetical protein n=1 Tax=Streptomyces sp. NPDC030592 TaxID=3155365 RepID=UPI0033CEFB06